MYTVGMFLCILLWIRLKDASVFYTAAISMH